MNNRKKITVCGALLAVLIITSCNMDGTGGYNSFAYDLRGTWVSNEPSIYYSGELEIDFNRITITGFSGNPFAAGEDIQRPFKGFTKGTALLGYSEDGKIYIEDAGILQEGIPYIYYTSGIYNQDKFLRFTFGGRLETLKKQSDY